ncbi:hypothetical protein [Metabacillus litoralis]|uniref:hypothetical protein n=1 Tax=Metabacillus litoralis TaxID=152268 RepID=UPI00203F4D2C|nr:hypothetical protein [Metabacillus litoralis]
MITNTYHLWTKEEYNYPVYGNFIPNVVSYIQFTKRMSTKDLQWLLFQVEDTVWCLQQKENLLLKNFITKDTILLL